MIFINYVSILFGTTIVVFKNIFVELYVVYFCSLVFVVLLKLLRNCPREKKNGS